MGSGNWGAACLRWKNAELNPNPFQVRNEPRIGSVCPSHLTALLSQARAFWFIWWYQAHTSSVPWRSLLRLFRMLHPPQASWGWLSPVTDFYFKCWLSSATYMSHLSPLITFFPIILLYSWYTIQNYVCLFTACLSTQQSQFEPPYQHSTSPLHPRGLAWLLQCPASARTCTEWTHLM